VGTLLTALIVEDVETDALLVLRVLKAGGFDVVHERVDTPETMAAALGSRRWDVVLCDYSMPRFNARAALALMRGKDLDIPFIIISGTVGEETAVDAMKAGVHDYFLKDKLGPRLVAAIERETREATIRAERRRMQDQLIISDRMASMGTLAAGIAHEINNPLAAVSANLDLAIRDVSRWAEQLGLAADFADVREELQDARDSAQRIRSIVMDLRIFSRSDADKKRPIDVQTILESTLRMARNEIRHRARVVKSYQAVPPVDASESRLGQVFLNLIVNATQAIDEGKAEENEIRISTRRDGDGRVVVEITDTGPGMAPDVLGRLFTPFFTTKPVGVGTGLGLSICHRIISDLGGSIRVESSMGKGTTFLVLLPPARTGVTADPRTAPLTVAASQRRGRVLVVDDEPLISKAVKRTLASDLDVTTFNRAEEALKEIENGQRFDVIICDLMMPHMTGMDLHAAVGHVDPEQAHRMIFLTGGAFSVRARAFLEEVSNRRIDKPFDPTALQTLIRELVS
jgi:signal transduction histidine kinase